MTDHGAGRSTASTMHLEKRGGYGSSSKPVGQLAPPPRGTAPGAKKPTPTADRPGRKS